MGIQRISPITKEGVLQLPRTKCHNQKRSLMNKLTKQANGHEIKVLLEWQKLYAEALADALKPTGHVLQIGFGRGDEATRIQSFKPKSHVIIEGSARYQEAAKAWGQKHPNATIVLKPWQAALPALKTFDSILFNEYPLDQEIEILGFLFPEAMQRTIKSADDLRRALEDQMAHITLTFTDNDIEKFYKEIGHYNPEALLNFFQQLKKNGNITKEQCDKFVGQYHVNEVEKKGAGTAKAPSKPAKPDYMVECLEACLKSHMNKGARFTCFLNNQTSKYGDSYFSDTIINNPHVHYEEVSVPIKTADKKREGLVILVEKSS